MLQSGEYSTACAKEWLRRISEVASVHQCDLAPGLDQCEGVNPWLQTVLVMGGLAIAPHPQALIVVWLSTVS